MSGPFLEIYSSRVNSTERDILGRLDRVSIQNYDRVLRQVYDFPARGLSGMTDEEFEENLRLSNQQVSCPSYPNGCQPVSAIMGLLVMSALSHQRPRQGFPTSSSSTWWITVLSKLATLDQI